MCWLYCTSNATNGNRIYCQHKCTKCNSIGSKWPWPSAFELMLESQIYSHTVPWVACFVLRLHQRTAPKSAWKWTDTASGCLVCTRVQLTAFHTSPNILQLNGQTLQFLWTGWEQVRCEKTPNSDCFPFGEGQTFFFVPIWELSPRCEKVLTNSELELWNMIFLFPV